MKRRFLLYLQKLYRDSLALLTDFYQLTMAYGYWKSGMADRKAVFHLFFRRIPFGGGFAVAAGLETVIDFIEHFRYSKEDIDYLRSLKSSNERTLFDPLFLEELSNLRFNVTLHAMEEGEVVFPQEPMIRVSGSLLQCQLLETPLLNLINFPTLIATKAARMRISAGKDTILEFGLRRSQGIDGALAATRAAYIGGIDATSNVLAGKLLNIPVRGTHSHSWVMAFDDELDSFYHFAKSLPEDAVFLVDTFNTKEGVKKAIEVGLWLREKGHRFIGIRLDSGDLAYLSKQARKQLDKAGLNDAVIAASNELDEVLIKDLKAQNAPIVIWGVGTSLMTAKGQNALDGVYKLSCCENKQGMMQDSIKLSEQLGKISNPGILNVMRFKDKYNIADVIYDETLELNFPITIVDPLDSTRTKVILKGDCKKNSLLHTIFKNGERVYDPPPLKEIKKISKAKLREFYTEVQRIHYPHQYVVGLEQKLYEKKLNLIQKIRKSFS